MSTFIKGVSRESILQSLKEDGSAVNVQWHAPCMITKTYVFLRGFRFFKADGKLFRGKLDQPREFRGLICLDPVEITENDIPAYFQCFGSEEMKAYSE